MGAVLRCAGGGFGLILYIILGGLMFWVMEKGHHPKVKELVKKRKEDFLANNSCVLESDLDVYVVKVQDLMKRATDQRWTIEGSVFFAFTVVSTIGYGNITPSNIYSRLFFMIYAVIGIPLFLIQLAALGSFLNRVLGLLSNYFSFFPDHPGRRWVLVAVVYHTLLLTSLLLLPALLFSVQEGWSYLDGLYYVVTTLTTIGFGDYITRGYDVLPYRLFLFAWVILGLAWFSQLVTKIQDIIDSYRTKNKVHPEEKLSNSKNNCCGKAQPSEGDRDNDVVISSHDSL